MTYPLYNAVLGLCEPAGRAYLSLRRPLRPLLGRLSATVPATEPGLRPLWIQSCSVGEINTARGLVHALAERWPQCPRILTTSTVTGHTLATSTDLGAAVAWCPLDVRRVVKAFISKLQPAALILMETELWPNLLRETRRFGAPVIVVNGRLSDKHLDRYRRYAKWLRPVVEQISAAGMQNEEYAERLVALGADPARVQVTGNIKFDGAAESVPHAETERLRNESGIGVEDPVLVFGSTRPGDEHLAAACWRNLRTEYPALKLVVAPRHADRLAEALAPFDEPMLRRTSVRAGQRPAGERIVVVDTTGELTSFYALATVAVVGGSFYPGVNGHNPIEPAALGVATVFGPLMRNFVDAARELVVRGGAAQVSDPEALLPELRRLLSNRAAREEMGVRGKAAVAANRGATLRTVDLIQRTLEEAEIRLP